MSISKMNQAIVILVLAIMTGILNMPAYADTYQLKDGVEIKDIFTIGSDDESSTEDDPYFFTQVYNVTCDSKGNLYVFDYKSQCVKVFDKAGKFIKKLFRPGNGPNEISNAFKVGINQFTDGIYMLQNYGYAIKEFDKSGKYVKLHSLPQQFYGQFEFIQEDRFLYIAFNNENKSFFNKFKVLNLKTRKIEKEFGRTSGDETHYHYQRLSIIDNTLWTTPGDHMKLLAYDLTTGKQIKEIDIPGKYKKNIIKTKKIHGGEMRRMIFFNFAQSFTVDGRLFVLVILQDYREEKNSVEDFPYKSKHLLFLLDGETLKLTGELKECDFMVIYTVWKNRVVLQGNDPYARVKVIELNVN